MVGCNCATLGAPVDNTCCAVDTLGDVNACDPVESRSFYCGFCEEGLAAVGCHVWVPACELQKRLIRLSIVRFKLQTGRDSVFTALQDLNIRRFSTYERFPDEIVIDMNNPRIFASLVSLVSAASFKDRLGEKTRGEFDRWSYDDALTAFHKSLGTIKKTIKSMAVSRRSFESRYKLKWLPAGTSVIRLSDSPTLYALDKALSESCLHPFATGAFFVMKDPEADTVEMNNDTLAYPNKPWNSPLECDGTIAIPRADGSMDIYDYHYVCRKFQFNGPIKHFTGTLAEQKTMMEAFQAQVLLTDNASCPSWVDKFLELINKKIEANKSRVPKDPENGGGGEKKPEEEKKPDQEKKPEDEKKPEEQKKPEDEVKPNEETKPEEDKPAEPEAPPEGGDTPAEPSEPEPAPGP